jgi:HK97 family phage major capsid protein
MTPFQLKSLREKCAELKASAEAIYRDADPKNTGVVNMPADKREQVTRILAELKSAREDLANGEMLAAQTAASAPVMDANDQRAYSILRAVTKLDRREPLDGLEREVSDEIAKRNNGRQPSGFYLPLELRDLTVSTGSGAVGTNVLGSLIDALRARLVAAQAGATVLSGMQGAFAIPRISAASTAYWVAASGTTTASNQTLDQVAFTPKTIGATTTIERKFMVQSSVDAEQLVRNDIASVIANGLDLAALEGTGANNQPLGVGANTNISHVSINAAPSYTNVVKLWSTVAAAHGDQGSLAFVTHPGVGGQWKSLDRSTNGSGIFIDNGSGVLGYPVYYTGALNATRGASSNQSSILFGNWSDLVIALFTGVDVIVDPYSIGTSGAVKLTMLQDCDINVRNTGSFARATNATVL